MKRSMCMLLLLSVVMMALPAVAFAQTGGPAGGRSGLCPDFLLSEASEADFTNIIDLIGYGPEGGRRVGVGCASSFKTVTINTQDAFGAACSAVVPYMMNSNGQMSKMDATCDGNVLSLPVTSNTHYFFYTFPGRGAGGAQQLVELSVEL